jgi:hypothetical protein
MLALSNRTIKTKHKILTRENLLYPMTYHVKLEKKIGIPSQAVDTSEKLQSAVQELS